MGNSLKSLNTRLYLDINHFAVHTAFAHTVMAFYAHLAGLGLLAILLLAAWWRARSAEYAPRAVASVLWAAGGTVIAWGIAHYGLKPLFGEVRPYNTLHGVEVLVARTNGYSFPSGHATIAGAVIMGLWLTKDKPLAWIATVASGLLGFDRIYVGAHYPFDVIAGMIFGCLVLLALFLPLVKLLTWFDNFLIKHTPFSPMVLAKTNWRPYPDYFDKQAS